MGNAPLVDYCARGDLDKVKESCQGSVLKEVLQKGLFEACHYGRLSVFQYLLTEQNCDPQCRNETGSTPLHVACFNGHLNIVQYLLTEQNCDPQCQDWKKWTPLHVACFYGHLNIVQYLLTQQNCDPQCRNESGWTPLHEACVNGHLNIVQYLLTEQNCDPQCRNETGWTPLHVACFNGRLNIVQYLLTEQNCDPQCRNESGWTPLHLACVNGHLNIVQYLLTEQNCDPRCQVWKKWTPLHLACHQGHLYIVQYLLTEQNCDPQCRDELEWTPLHVACANGHLNIVQYLLTEQNCDPQCRNKAGRTPLHLACHHGHLYIVQYLLTEQNCDPQCRKKETGSTPLHVVCQKGHLNIVQYLLTEQNCDPQCRDWKRCTPLHVACANGHLNIVQYLLAQQNCDPQCRDRTGWTPLHVACANGHLIIVQYLLTEQNCDPQCRDWKKWTPLHVACANGHLNIVQYLLTKQNCDPQCRNETGWTPLHSACTSGHLNIVHYLLTEQNCDPQCRDKSEKTPLHLACEYGHLDIVECLIADRRRVIDCRDRVRSMALVIAAEHGNWDVVNYLLLEHFKREEYDQIHHFCQNTYAYCQTLHEWPWNVLEYCIRTAYLEGKVDIVCCLVKEGKVNVVVDVLASGNRVQKQIVLLTACEYGQLPVVKYLTSEQHCDPERQNEQGETPLHVACRNGHLNIVQYLLTEQNCDPQCRDARGRTLLHVAAIGGYTNITRFLLLLPSSQVDVQDADGCTPLDLTTSNSMWDLLVQHGADPLPVTLAKWLEAIAIQAHPTPPSYIKLYIIGNQGSGKSTLAKAIKDEHVKDGSENVQDVSAHTAGIILSEFESEEIGHVVIYDFAGHREYYASHSAVLENSLSFTAVFLALVDLRDSPSDIALQLHYWVSFIESYRVSAVWHPHVLVIGSHLDECTNPEVRVSTLDETLKATRMLSFVCITGIVAMDCRKPASENMAQVRSHLKNSCSQLRKIREDLTESDFYKNVKAFLDDFFEEKLGLRLHTLVQIAQKTDLWFLHSPLDIFKLCEELSDRGHILFLPNLDCIEESWIVVDKQTLLSKINGTLFAPPEFSRHHNISSSTGVVALSEIATLFNDLDPDLILQCLVHLEFCQLIKDPEILKNLELTDRSSTEPVSESAAIFPSSSIVDDSDQLKPPAPPIEEKYLFFPSLVSIERPSLVWSEQEGFEYHCGWYLHCKHPHHFFTSRFLQVLLLRLAFLFVLPSPPEPDEDTSPVKNRECSVWKNGVRWLDMNGIETVVEMLGQQKGVLVVMRCAEGSARLACIKLRTAIISQVLEAKNEFCHNVVTIESLLEPTDLKKQYPAQNLPDLKHYHLSTIERAILEGKPFVYDQSRTRLTKLEDLLYFEPYVHLGEDILSQIFKPTNAQKVIPEQFLGDIAEKASSIEHVPPSQLKDAILVRMHEFAKVLKVPPQVVEVYNPARSLLYIFKEGLSRCKEQTYSQLKSRLDKYSILRGRDINFKVVPGPDREDDPEVKPTFDGVDNTKLDQDDDLCDVLEEVVDVTRWFDLGLACGLKTSTLEKIKISNRDQVDDCRRDMLIQWLRRVDRVDLKGVPSWRSLAIALNNPIVRYPHIARKIARKHPQQ